MRPVPQLPREFVVAAQRRRAVEAVAEIAHEFGVGAITVVGVCRVARMGRATFYRLFDGLGGCLRYSFSESFNVIVAPMATETGEDGWPSAVVTTIETLYGSVSANPLLAELCLVHSNCLPETAAGKDFEAVVAEVASRLSAASTESGRQSLPFVDGFLARAIISLAASRARQGETDQLASDGREMASVVEAAYPPA